MTKVLAWLGFFACVVLAQLPVNGNTPLPGQVLSESKRNLVQNASIPIFLSENSDSSVRQLENLIQNTDIRQIRIFTSDQDLVAQVLNGTPPESARETHSESLPVVFQGSLAGSLQVDIAYSPQEIDITAVVFEIVSKAIILTTLAWLCFTFFRFTQIKLFPRLYIQKRSSSVLTQSAQSISQPESFALLIYLQAEKALAGNPEAYRDFMMSFYSKLEDHLRIYGGRILNHSDNRLLCKLPLKDSVNSEQQALIFCWGITRPLVYEQNGDEYRVEVRSLLHRTQLSLKAGANYQIASEILSEMEDAVLAGSQQAFVSQALADHLKSSDFRLGRNDRHSDIYPINSAKRSIEVLWQKQEAMISVGKS